MPEPPEPSQQSKKKGTYKCSKCKSAGHRANNCLKNRHFIKEEIDVEKSQTEVPIPSNVPIESSAPPFDFNIEQSIHSEDASEWKNQTEALKETSSVDHNSPASEDSFELKWNRDLWGPDDEPKCPLCDEPLPQNPSDKFKEMLRFQLAKPHAKKRPLPGNPDAVALPYIERASTCNQHHIERNIIPLGQERGWPSSIDPEALSR
ncbi:hypothetical protein DFH28DRAFT_880128 [Melampsora americana]|nr:hypothetical protein DFH28DRAFT_880128 [Melampsora americana]